MDNKIAEYLFHQGTLYNAYQYMGCQLLNLGKGAFFRVFAPNGVFVSVVGDFNGWNKHTHEMKRITERGLYEIFVPEIAQLDKYKFYIVATDGREFYKCDPYALHAEWDGEKASKAYNINEFVWNDGEYQSLRSKQNVLNMPTNIYEAHIGSWRKYLDGNCFDYVKFADEIVPYLVSMNYNHLELMGIAEYPFDGSWGYQVTGYFAPTSRYGKPSDFAYLVDKCHTNNIAVILDWVPGHFPKDAHGLYEFDGSPLYEPQGKFRMEHKEWGTRCFDYGREEVQTFLISNALMWLDKYHVDGLRVDAVASMLYLDYNRRDGEWAPNSYGGKENLDAIAFFQKLNTQVFAQFPKALMIAEESTAFPMVTMPVDKGGLGFNFKWNMGWMNDNLSYIKTDPYFRSHSHNKLTFSMSYAFSENYILPISHDEVVHGKGSLIGKMPGDYDLKMAGFRNFLMNMYTHPGKKLIFMGTEFSQFAEWDYKKELDWQLLDYPAHASNQKFVQYLNGLYLTKLPLHQIDNDWTGFEWLVANDNRQNIIIYHRIDSLGNKIICVYNFSPLNYDTYTFGVDEGTYKTILISELSSWSPKGESYKSRPIASHNKQHSLTIAIPPMSGQLLANAKVTSTKSKKS